jgi:hypothetical protein
MDRSVACMEEFRDVRYIHESVVFRKNESSLKMYSHDDRCLGSQVEMFVRIISITLTLVFLSLTSQISHFEAKKKLPQSII